MQMIRRIVPGAIGLLAIAGSTAYGQNVLRDFDRPEALVNQWRVAARGKAGRA